MRYLNSICAGGLGLALTLAASAADGPGKCPPYTDGKMTQAEWQTARAPEPSWNMFTGKEKIKS